MSEFERSPESMQAELTEIYKKITDLDNEYAAIPDGDLTASGNYEAASSIMDRTLKLKREAYQIILAIGNLDEIRNKLTEEAEMYLEAGMEPDFNALLFETFGLDENYSLEPQVQELIEIMQAEVETEE